MKFIAALSCLLFAMISFSCADYNRIVKTQDYEYKYEAAKQYYAEGMYNRAALLLQDVLSVLKGTEQGEESLYLTGLCNMKAHSYDAAATVFKKYYKTAWTRVTHKSISNFHKTITPFYNKYMDNDDWYMSFSHLTNT